MTGTQLLPDAPRAPRPRDRAGPGADRGSLVAAGRPRGPSSAQSSGGGGSRAPVPLGASLDRLRSEALNYSLWAANGGGPSAAGEIPSTFSSAAEYVAAFEPLLFEECRAQVLSQWEEATELAAACHLPVRVTSLERADRGSWEVWLETSEPESRFGGGRGGGRGGPGQHSRGDGGFRRRNDILANWKDGDIAVLSSFHPKKGSKGPWRGGPKGPQNSNTGGASTGWRIAGTIRKQQQEGGGPGRTGPLLFLFHHTAVSPDLQVEQLLKPDARSAQDNAREQGGSQGGHISPAEPAQLYVTPLGSLTTSQREFEALHAVHRLPSHVLDALLHPCAEYFPDYSQADPPDLSSVFSHAFTNYLQSSFNEPQLRAIHWAAAHSASTGDAPEASADTPEEHFRSPHLHTEARGEAAGPSPTRAAVRSASPVAGIRKGQWEDDTRAWPFTLVQGPPGTGKTHTVWGMLNVIHLVHYQQHYSALLKSVEEQSTIFAVAGRAAGQESKTSAQPSASASSKASGRSAALAEAPLGVGDESKPSVESKAPCKKSRTPRPQGKAAAGGGRAPGDTDQSGRAGAKGAGSLSMGPGREAGARKDGEGAGKVSSKRGSAMIGQRGPSKGSEAHGQEASGRPVGRVGGGGWVAGEQDSEPPAKKARTAAEETEATGISDLLQSMQEQVLAPAAAAASRGRERGNEGAGWYGGGRGGGSGSDADLAGILQGVHKPRMLVCAPSNAAVDELLTRVLDKGFLDGELRVYRPDVARIGADASSPAAQAVSVERRTEALLAMPPGDAFAHWHILRDRLQQLHWEVLTHMQSLQQRSTPDRGPQDPAAANGACAGTGSAQDAGAGGPRGSEGAQQPAAPGHPDPAAANVAPVASSGSGAKPEDPRTAGVVPSQHAEQESETRRHALLQRIAAAVEEQHKVGVEAERMALVCSLSPDIGPLPPVRAQGRPVWASNGAWAGSDGYGGHRAVVRGKLEASFADEAEIIFTTASSSGRRIMRRLSHGFDVLVIDEAAQASEVAVLPPLSLSCQRCVLIGDPQQLPATVISRTASALNYSRSLLERFQSRGCPTILLNVQFRMHPAIRHFPSRFFYQNQLQDSASVLSRPDEPYHADPLLRPFLFFDVPASASLQTYENREEARTAVALFMHLQRTSFGMGASGPVPVGVVTPYRQQLRLLTSLFQDVANQARPQMQALQPNHAHTSSLQPAAEVDRLSAAAAGSPFLQCNTIDAFQGQERDVIIVSCVRASSRSLGFVADVRRLNVAITRAKKALWVLGNVTSLQRSPAWAALIKDAAERDCLLHWADFARRLQL